MVLEAVGQQMKCLEIWTAACKLQGLGQNGLHDLLQLLLKRFRSDRNLEKQEVNGEQAEMKKMDAAAWKKHVAMQHRPYRRDCRRCLEMMGSDGHHRQTPGDRAGYCLSLDIVGPMPICDDVGLAPGNGIPPKAKYMMGATVAIPRIKMETEEEPKVVLGVAEDTTLPKLDVVDDEASRNGFRGGGQGPESKMVGAMSRSSWNQWECRT